MLSLQNLGWLDDLKADAAKAKTDIGAFNNKVKTAVVTDATRVKTAVVADATHVKTAVIAHATQINSDVATGAADAWKAVSTDLILDGKKCGTNPICQELSRYGVNVNHHIDHLVIEQWLKTGQYGQWCASSNICMSAVKEAQHDFTHGERQAVNNWLHPAHTTESLLQNLGWWADIKADAAKAKAALAADAAKAKADASKAIHFVEKNGKVVVQDFEVAGEKCGSNAICTEIAMKGAGYLEGKENTLVMGWIKTNQKAAWCESNHICMQIVNKALSTATVAETAAVDKWLHQSTNMPSTMPSAPIAVKPTMILMMI